MNLNSGYFPIHNYRRKQTTPSFNLPFNNQQKHHHHAASLSSARSSIESAYGNESFLPLISNGISHNKPYHRNDFANNHLFLAKRKLAGILLGQPTKNLQSSSELIHLFDEQKPKRKKQNLNKHKRQENLRKKTSSSEQDIHLSVVNLIMKSPYPSSQTRDPLSSVLRRRSEATHFPPKVLRSSNDTLNSTVKQNLQASLHTFTDEDELDELIDNDNISDAISSTINPFDSSLLCVKAIIPSAHTHR